MKTTLASVTAVLAVVALAACGGDDDEAPALGQETTSTTTEVEPFETTEGRDGDVEVSQECADAFESVGAFDPAEDDFADLYPAAKACGSIDEWVAGASEAGVLDEAAAEPVVRDVCRSGRADDPELVDAPLCRQVTT